MRRPTRTCVLVLLSACGLLATLPGCNGQRALPVVRESGARALDRQQYELAAQEFREVLDRDPGDWRSRLSLAEALLELGRAREAREQLEIVYTVRLNDPEVVDALARAMVESGDVRGMTDFLRGVALERGGVEDHLRLAHYLAVAGDMDEARQALLEAARLDQGRSVEVQLALADFYRQLGDQDAALERYRMALYLDPRNTAAIEAIREMGKIPGPTYALPPAEMPRE